MERRNNTVLQQWSSSELLPGIIKLETVLCWTAGESLYFSPSLSQELRAQSHFTIYNKIQWTAFMGMCGGISVGFRDCVNGLCDVIVSLQHAERSGLPADYPCSTYVWPVYHQGRRAGLEWSYKDIDGGRRNCRVEQYIFRARLLLSRSADSPSSLPLLPILSVTSTCNSWWIVSDTAWVAGCLPLSQYKVRNLIKRRWLRVD